MHRFFLPPEESRDATLSLKGREAHHALHVLRVQPGDRVTVLDGAGQERLCSVQVCHRDKVTLEVVEKRSVPPLPWRVTLLQGLPKGKLIESIIQKATELGVARVVPLLSERVVTRLDAKEAAHKTEKWRLTAIEAIKQCGSAWLPQIEPPLTPGHFLARRGEFDLALVASLQPGGQHPRQHFARFTAKSGRPPASVCVWVGPEGDFAASEMEAIQSAGVLPITLGPLVLRCETAAVYCLSVLNYELQQLPPACQTSLTPLI
jgi:16S rRNA (uracil1498-N3)-methyltransferase